MYYNLLYGFVYLLICSKTDNKYDTMARTKQRHGVTTTVAV